MNRKIIVLCCFLACFGAMALFGGKMYKSYNTRSNPAQVNAHAGYVVGGTPNECMIIVKSNLQVSTRLDALTVVTTRGQTIDVLNNRGFFSGGIKLSRLGSYSVKIAISPNSVRSVYAQITECD